MSKFKKRSFAVNRERDGVRAGRKCIREATTLAGGMDELRAGETRGYVSSDDAVVV